MNRQLSRRQPGLIDRLALRFFYTERIVDGLWLGGFENEALDRAAAALELIKVSDPRRYKRLPRDIDRVLITVLHHGSIAQFKASINACELDERFVLLKASSLETIASLIVHEATHARLEHLGFRYEESRRARLEAICLRRERAFLARLPDAHAARARVEWALNNRPDLTNAALADRREAAVREAARYAGLSDRSLRVISMFVSIVGAAQRFLRRLRPPA